MAAPGDCAICLDVRQNPAMTPCMHVFCRTCIGDWLGNHSACPICRHSITRGRRALVTLRDNTTPRRASSAPATRPLIPLPASTAPATQPFPVSGAMAPAAPRRPRADRQISSNSTQSIPRAPSVGASRVSRATASRTPTTPAVATTRSNSQPRRTDVRAALCTNRCSPSQQEAFRRNGG